MELKKYNLLNYHLCFIAKHRFLNILKFKAIFIENDNKKKIDIVFPILYNVMFQITYNKSKQKYDSIKVNIDS